MVDFILALVFLFLAFIFLELEKGYKILPLDELRFRAKHNNPVYDLIYRVNTFNKALDYTLWFLITLSATLGVVLFNKIAPFWIGLIAVALFLFILFIWLPNRKLNKTSIFFIKNFTPLLIKFLNISYPLFGRLKLNKERSIHYQNSVFEFGDLKKFYKNLSHKDDIRITNDELKILINFTKLFTKSVSEVGQNYSKLTKIKVSDPISPVVLDELYKSKQDFILVLDKQKKVVGYLDIKNVDIRKEGRVEDYIQTDLNYLSEEDSLIEVFLAYQKTGSLVYLIVDDNQKTVGLINVKDVIDLILKNKNLVNDFNYSSIDEVSKKYLNTEINPSDKIE
jgi:hypothetical protein